MAEHQLDKPSFTTAGVLFGLWGGGAAVTQAFTPMFWLGIVICLGSACFTVWRYGQPIRAMVGHSVPPSDRIPVWEAISVSLLVLIEFVGSAYLGGPPLFADCKTLWAKYGQEMSIAAYKLATSPIFLIATALVMGFLIRPVILRLWNRARGVHVTRDWRTIFAYARLIGGAGFIVYTGWYLTVEVRKVQAVELDIATTLNAPTTLQPDMAP